MYEITGKLIEVRTDAADAGPAIERLAEMGSWRWDRDSGEYTASPEWYRLHGLSRGEGPLTFTDLLAAIHPDDRDRLARQLARDPRDPGGYSAEYRVVMPSGAVRWIAGRGESVLADDGRLIGATGYAQDVTHRKVADHERVRALRELSQQQRVLEKIARGEPLDRTLGALCRLVERRYTGARCSIFLMDDEASVLRLGASPSLPASYRRAVGIHPIGEGAGCCGTAAHRRRPFAIADMQEHPYTAPFVEVAEALGMHGAASYPLIGSGGRLLGTFAIYRPEIGEPTKAQSREVGGATGLAVLAIEHERTQDELRLAARVDAVTQLPNRGRFMAALTDALRDDAAPVAVLFVDLDRFQLINESLGHASGDRILGVLAGRLRDAVGEEALAARFGGDEFIVLVRDATPERVGMVADQVKAALTAPLEHDGGEFFLSASIGIALNDHEADAYALVRDADAAMYAAKESGPGRRVQFDRAMREEVLSRVKLETFLRHAIEQREFVMLHQPIVDVAHGRWAGFEALARWNRPEIGLISPDVFIPLAEESGLIIPLGELIIDLAIGDAVAMFARLGGDHDLYVAVNVSVIQLHDPTLAATVAAALERHGLPPRQLVVEVTESAVMASPEQAGIVLQELTDLGVRVLIDDFGTGHSSIARLGDLPGAGVKIDRRFTAALGSDARAEKILEAIASLAHAHEHPVIVEGIESAEALAAVARLGCEYAQGYHLAMPAREADVVAVLEQPPPAV